MVTVKQVGDQLCTLLVLVMTLRFSLETPGEIIFTKIQVSKVNDTTDGVLWSGSVISLRKCHFICLMNPSCVYLEYRKSYQTCKVFNNIHQKQSESTRDLDTHQWAVSKHINKRTVPQSCAEVRTCSRSSQDGEYWIYPAVLGGYQRIKVYCHKLESEASEYITLHYSNYMVHHDRTNLLDVWAPCSIPSSIPVKTVFFHKIRLNITTMLVDQRDYTFTTITGNQALQLGVGYGETVDCGGEYWQNPCTFYGTVEINTLGTGLVVDPSETWIPEGWETSVYQFERSADNTYIRAKCSGWCGACKPTSNTISLQTTTETVPFLDAGAVVCET